MSPPLRLSSRSHRKKLSSVVEGALTTGGSREPPSGGWQACTTIRVSTSSLLMGTMPTTQIAHHRPAVWVTL